jgi:Tfp pilus assembly protein PilF
MMGLEQIHPWTEGRLMTIHPAAASLGMLVMLACAQPAGAVTPDGPGVQMLKVENHRGARDYFAAALREHPQDAQAMAGMAKLELTEAHNKAAVEWASKAAAVAPTNAEYQMLLGYAYAHYIHNVNIFRRLGMAHKVRAAFKRAVELAPDSADGRADLASFYILAPGIAGGNLAKAKLQLDALDKLDPVRANALHAEIAMKQHDPAAAGRYMRTAAKIDATGSGDLYLGKFLVSQKDYTGAFTAFETGIHEHPSNSANYYQFGRLATITGTHVQAGIRDLKKYLTMPHRWQPDTPTYKWARYRLGVLYSIAGDEVAARSQYRAALAMDPDFKQAAAALHAQQGGG